MQAPPRSRVFYGWWIVAAGFLNQAFAAALLQRAFGSYSVLLRQEFGWSKTELAAAASMQQLENGMLGPLQGWFVDRFGPRLSMRLGVAAFGIGFLLFRRRPPSAGSPHEAREAHPVVGVSADGDTPDATTPGADPQPAPPRPAPIPGT